MINKTKLSRKRFIHSLLLFLISVVVMIVSGRAQPTVTHIDPGTTNSLGPMSFPSSQIGYMISNSTDLLKTTDGGASWFTVFSDVDGGLFHLDFTTEQVGFLTEIDQNIPQARILKTIDGGVSWDTVFTGTGAGLWQVIWKIQFLDSLNGYATMVSFSSGGGVCTEFGVDWWSHLLKSTDGGNTWTVAQYFPGCEQIFEFHFVSTQVGYHLGLTPPWPFNIRKSTNGGVTWSSSLNFPHNAIRASAIDFWNENIGIHVGQSGLIQRTLNGGQTWLTGASGISSDLADVEFIDSLTVLACGPSGVLIYSNDGGATWAGLNTQTANSLGGISVRPDGTAFISGENGTLLTLGSLATPLPVELTSFKAVEAQGAIQLLWTTSSEINNDYFSIEKSPNGVDFVAIGSVSGHGTTSQPQKYSFTDFEPIHGENYYRLVQYDFNGEFELSYTVSVIWTTDPATLEPRVLIANGFLSVENRSFYPITTTILSMAAQPLDSQVIAPGETHSYSIANLKPGIYIIHSSCPAFNHKKKILVSNY